MNKNDDGDEFFLQNNLLVKGAKPYSKSGPQSEILTTANLTYHDQVFNLCRTWVVLKKIKKSISVDLQFSNNMK